MSANAFDQDQALWTELARAPSTESMARPWLALQCRMIVGVSRGVVLLGAPDQGPFEPVATWPADARVDPTLAAAAQTALGERRPVVRRYRADGAAKAPCDVGYPLVVDERLCGVVALELEWRPQAELGTVMRQLQWGAASLAGLLRREIAQKETIVGDRLVSALELVATCLDSDRFQEAATALVTDLSTRLGCDRVSVGFVAGKHAKVRALSHSAKFGEQTNLVRAIGEAMDEAVDQRGTVVVPAPEGGGLITQAHAQLARRHSCGAICTVPLDDADHVVGALTLERPLDRPFSPQEVALCEDVAALVGPILELKRLDDRWLAAKAWDSVREHAGQLFGPDHLGLKAGCAAAVALGLFLALARGELRVAADATLEGAVKRVIAAPIDGFVATAPARAGDIVEEGDLLCQMDDRELDLERRRWASEREQLRGQHRQAIAQGDRAEVGILQAQLDRADAQVGLLEQQISRLHLVAPYLGIVVSGDLSQSLGAPLKRGDVLFEVAPLDAYRIILEVDERDIAHVAPEKAGHLVLVSMPSRPLPFVVKTVTPVSVAEEGKNYFRVEARLADSVEVDDLRPGMEGVGKIDAGRHHLAWIWTRRIVDWARLKLWSWLP